MIIVKLLDFWRITQPSWIELFFGEISYVSDRKEQLKPWLFLTPQSETFAHPIVQSAFWKSEEFVFHSSRPARFNSPFKAAPVKNTPPANCPKGPSPSSFPQSQRKGWTILESASPAIWTDSLQIPEERRLPAKGLGWRRKHLQSSAARNYTNIWCLILHFLTFYEWRIIGRKLH